MSRNSFDEKKKVSVFSVVEVIIIVILVLMILGMAACNIIFRKDNSATSIFGYSFYKTRAVNMVPEIPVNTVIIAKKSEIPNIKERSVILCNIGEYTALTRVVEIQQEEGKTYYIVKFDTSPANETFRVESNAVIAKAIWQLESFGKFLDFATSVPGIIIAVIIPLAVIIIMQVIRIRNIRELEREASSLDDIDDLIMNRDKEKPSPVTFTEPKFSEDVTGKLPNVKAVQGVRPVTNSFDFNVEGVRPKSKLSVDENGLAEYKPSNKPQPQPEPEKQSPLFTYDRLTGKASDNSAQPVAAAVKQGAAERDDRYINRPTRIDDSFVNDLVKSEKSEEKVVFTPHLSNIIPESIANIQEEAASPSASSFDESVKAYFDKNERRSETVRPLENEPEEQSVSTIPENAVVPKETIAPVKKKKNSKTLEELMSFIDAEETKLKK